MDKDAEIELLKRALQDARNILAGMTPSYGHQLKEKIRGLEQIDAIHKAHSGAGAL